MTKEQLILKHLKSGRPITPMQAWHKYGCYRLGARVCALRQAGYAITTKLIKTRDRNGRVCRVAEYRM